MDFLIVYLHYFEMQHQIVFINLVHPELKVGNQIAITGHPNYFPEGVSMTFEANDILAAHLAGFEGKAI